MHAGDSCRPYRAAGQIQRFTHHRKTQHVNEAEMNGKGERQRCLGGDEQKVHMEADLSLGDIDLFSLFILSSCCF